MSVPQVAITALTHYLQKGDPRGPAVGVVSVLYAGESQLNPGPQPSSVSTDRGGVLYSSGAYGIASWNGDRQGTLNNYALARGVNLLTTDTTTALLIELDFVITEMFNSYPKSKAAWLAAQSYAQFIPIFVAEYEGPRSPSAEDTRALAFASQLDAAVPQVPPAPTSPRPQTPVPMPIPQPPAPGGAISMNPIVLALVDYLAQAFAQAVVDAVFAKIGGGLALPAPVGGTNPAPASPALNVASLASELAPLLQLTPAAPVIDVASLANQIATEWSKLQPPHTPT